MDSCLLKLFVLSSHTTLKQQLRYYRKRYILHTPTQYYSTKPNILPQHTCVERSDMTKTFNKLLTVKLYFQVRNEFYKDSQGVILVYDVGLRESFDALDSWLTEMKQEMGSQANMESIIFVVCANKVSFTYPIYSVHFFNSKSHICIHPTNLCMYVVDSCDILL